jgi:hypothetical protein
MLPYLNCTDILCTVIQARTHKVKRQTAQGELQALQKAAADGQRWQQKSQSQHMEQLHMLRSSMNG